MDTPNQYEFVRNYYNTNRSQYNFFLPENPTSEQERAYEQERARFTYNVAIELHALDSNWGLLRKEAGQNHGTDFLGNMFGVDTLLYLGTGQIIDILTKGIENPVTWQLKDFSNNWFAPISSLPPDNGNGTGNGGSTGGGTVDNSQIAQAIKDVNSTLQMIYNKMEEIRVVLVE